MKNFIIKLKTKIASKWHELLNDPAGPHSVAMSFAIGVISEMLTIPTAGIAFILMIAVVKWLKFSLTSALVGYFFTKIVYIPLAPLELKKLERVCSMKTSIRMRISGLGLEECYTKTLNCC